MTKEASGACLPCNTAQHPIAARAARRAGRQGARHWPGECLSMLEVGIDGPARAKQLSSMGVPKSCRACRCRSRSVAILAIAAAFTVLAATILPTEILTATKLPTVLATTILTTWATIALMIWASGGAQR